MKNNFFSLILLILGLGVFGCAGGPDEKVEPRSFVDLITEEGDTRGYESSFPIRPEFEKC